MKKTIYLSAVTVLTDMIQQAESCHDCRLKQVILLDLKAHWARAWSLPDPHAYRPWLGDIRKELDALLKTHEDLLSTEDRPSRVRLYYTMKMATINPLFGE